MGQISTWCEHVRNRLAQGPLYFFVCFVVVTFNLISRSSSEEFSTLPLTESNVCGDVGVCPAFFNSSAKLNVNRSRNMSYIYVTTTCWLLVFGNPVLRNARGRSSSSVFRPFNCAESYSSVFLALVFLSLVVLFLLTSEGLPLFPLASTRRESRSCPPSGRVPPLPLLPEHLLNSSEQLGEHLGWVGCCCLRSVWMMAPPSPLPNPGPAFSYPESCSGQLRVGTSQVDAVGRQTNCLIGHLFPP